MKITGARYLSGCIAPEDCPAATLPEFAFIGRSNVGKSSLINMITGTKNLAKTSNTPGKTQIINHFLVNEAWYLVDLPGYGYAKSSQKKRVLWQKMIEKYLLTRKNLLTTFLLIDLRHEPQNNDMLRISWFGESGLPFVLVFTKADKVNKQILQRNLEQYAGHLSENWSELPLAIVTSAVQSRGKEDILGYIGDAIAKTGKKGS